MTDKIKSAIHCMRANQGIGFCEECPAYAKVGKGHCVGESCRIAENSLKAWEEVLNELEKRERIYEKNEFLPLMGDMYYWKARNIGVIAGITETIDVIKQKLAEIEE